MRSSEAIDQIQISVARDPEHRVDALGCDGTSEDLETFHGNAPLWAMMRWLLVFIVQSTLAGQIAWIGDIHFAPEKL